ncbi:histidine phosphatase family protein [Sporolactobacillus terrae]|uniref:Histidine phosphatase family protein n=1 Tax=Sporolactobacillus terrae TaxID=269673 RepID=A0ABX5Q649_9BACL|nr:histidine phosphatase family protein [Sporolactobacillus terrae]QAA22116.1 histidine phosphatase family protein [Sporolactobacillus terrae]QAA25088.1 histidine phosphatase family protein [Sporolactobacillus terrae]UAK16910.1 phosphoglycerate mutase family protein [Sporolactobacillus terrae]
MKSIYFVRHGRTLFNQLWKVQGISDTPLTELGEKKAAELGTRFKAEKITFDGAYSSDLGRTRRTSRLILDHSANPELTPIETKDLREVSFGQFEGDPNDSMWEAASEAAGDPELRGDSPDELKIKALDGLKRLDTTGLAENFEDVKTRIRAILSVMAHSDEQNILAVSHGLYISCLIYLLSDAKIHVSSIENTSVTKVVFENGVFKIAYIGRTENL